MNSENYIYEYTGNDIYHFYFASHPIDQWNYKDFQLFFNTARIRNTQKNSLSRSYMATLNCIKNNSGTPESIKNYINVLLNEVIILLNISIFKGNLKYINF